MRIIMTSAKVTATSANIIMTSDEAILTFAGSNHDFRGGGYEGCYGGMRRRPRQCDGRKRGRYAKRRIVTTSRFLRQICSIGECALKNKYASVPSFLYNTSLLRRAGNRIGLHWLSSGCCEQEQKKITSASGLHPYPTILGDVWGKHGKALQHHTPD